MLTLQTVLEVELLLLAANGAPVLAARLLDARCAWPLDGGAILADGRPLLGPSKTWRGLVAGIVTSAAVAWLLGLTAGLGALVGGLSLLGDLCSSFVKRRFGIASSGRAVGLDQIPEVLLPLLVCRGVWALEWASIAVLSAIFLVGSLLLSRLSYHLGIKRQPY